MLEDEEEMSNSYSRKNIFPEKLLFLRGVRKTFADEQLKVFFF